MKFGKSYSKDIGAYPIPEDHPIINELPTTDSLAVYLGGTQWGMKDYVGTWYEPGTPQKKFLSAYAQQFGCVELNATHYRTFPPEQFAEWKKMAPHPFKFLPKLPQSISHYRRLTNTQEVVEAFCEGVRVLEDQTGPAFLQLPENYSAKDANILFTWLSEWPSDVELAIELRHPSWFENKELVDEIAAFLHTRNIGWVITDSPGRMDVLHMVVPCSKVIIRYAGWELDALDLTRLNNWIERIASWEKSGVEEVYFCIHQAESIATPDTAIYMHEGIKKASADIAVIGYPQRLSLF